jgi:hypothetical protein
MAVKDKRKIFYSIIGLGKEDNMVFKFNYVTFLTIGKVHITISKVSLC